MGTLRLEGVLAPYGDINGDLSPGHRNHYAKETRLRLKEMEGYHDKIVSLIITR